MNNINSEFINTCEALGFNHRLEQGDQVHIFSQGKTRKLEKLAKADQQKLVGILKTKLPKTKKTATSNTTKSK